MMETEDKFFGRIEDTLHSYEDVYPVGAWEDFRKERKRRRGIVLFLKLGSAAAVLLFLSYFTIQFFNKDTITNQFAQTKPTSRQQKDNTVQLKPGTNKDDALVSSHKVIDKDKINEPEKQVETVQKPAIVTHIAKITPIKENPLIKETVAQHPVTIVKDNPVIANVVVPDKTIDVNSSNSKAMSADTARPVNSAVTANVIVQTEVKKYTGSTKSVYDSIVNSNRPVTPRAATIAKKSEKNLSYGVVVSPALGNQKVDFGTGVEVAYKINKNFFISSGIAYASLNAAGSNNNLYAATAGNAAGGKDVTLQVSGFEVPIGVQYRTDNGFYISAGIVAMGVTDNKLQYNYVAQTTAIVQSFDSSNMLTSAIQVVNEKKTEDVKEKLNNYLGFYMMSIGTKKKIGNNQFTFGPFMRVPFGAVSSQKINLFQGGIKLGFEF
jgi:cytoskeletal protein RodZ